MDNKKTGYPHIDKPWMKYYEGRDFKEEIPNKNLVEVLKERNQSRMSNPASVYFSRVFNYGELFANADDASKALDQLGVRKKDIILSLVPNMPEDDSIMLGANQLGAAINYADPMPGLDAVASSHKLLNMIKIEKEKAIENGYDIRHIVTVNQAYASMIKPIENELKELGISDLVLLDISSSMNENGLFEYAKDILNYKRIESKKPLVDKSVTLEELKRIITTLKSFDDGNMFLKEMIKTSPLNVHSYDELVQECKNSHFEIVNDPDLIAYIGHTSGTSGAVPKPVTLTNKAIMSSFMQCDVGGLGPKEGETVLHFLPGFAAFGRINNGLQTYYSRAVNIHAPEFPLNNFEYLVLRLKPNVIMSTPAFLMAMVKNPGLKNEDLSFINKIFYGGSAMKPEDEKELNEFLKNHNCITRVEQGYGLSETAGGASYAKDDYKRYASTGIPLPGTTISIVDPSVKDKLVPLKMEDGMDKLEGELVITGGQLTDGSFAPEGKVVFQEMPEDGKMYLRTGDIGYMDKDGIFYSKGRGDRGFIRQDGYNVRPYLIEPELEKNKYVENAVIVPYYDDVKCGLMPICHLTLTDEGKKENDNDVISDIVNNTMISNPDLDPRQIPAKFKIRETMPLNKMRKINFKALETEELSGDEINVVLNQTNVAIEGIDIFKNKSKARKRVK